MTPLHGVVLFAHGSRDPAWREPIEAVAHRIREIEPGTPISCAYLELTSPDLPTCVAKLLSEGCETITIWPMFLGNGRHAREDLPRLTAELRAQYPQAQFVLQAAIGEHPDVLETMAKAVLMGC